MYDDSSALLPHHVDELRAWLSDWYDSAYRMGYVRPPFAIDEAVVDRLEGYFRTGLTPTEGALAFFGTVH